MRTPIGAEKGTAGQLSTLLICVLMFGASAGAGAQGRPERNLVQSRLLLLFAPNPTDKQYIAQIGMLRGKESGFAMRQLVQFDLFGPGHASRQGRILLPASRAEMLRGRYQVPAGRFILVLIGKDGQEAFRSEKPIPAARIFSRIDSMPMRREEMRRAGGNLRGMMSPPPAGKAALLPGPKLSPKQVVWAQLYAMQHNDIPRADSGIATTFAFASPRNRQITGPLPHFISIVKTAQYLPMFQFRQAAFPPTIIQGDQARQPVQLSDGKGHIAYFLFQLSRQRLAPFKDCWMTDGVTRMPGPNRNINI